MRSEKIFGERAYVHNLFALLSVLAVLGYFIDQCLSGSWAAKGLFIFIFSFHMPLLFFLVGAIFKDHEKDRRTIQRLAVSSLGLYVLMKTAMSIVSFFLDGKWSFSLLSESGAPWIFFTTAVYLLLACCLKRVNRRVLLGLSIILALLCGHTEAIGDFLVLSRTIVFLPFFILGWMCGIEQTEQATNKKWLRLHGMIILVLALFITVRFASYGYHSRPLFSGRSAYAALGGRASFGSLYRLFCYCISGSLLVSILSVMPRKSFGTYVDSLGTSFVQIYFWHCPILYIMTGLGVYDRLDQTFGRKLGRIIWVVCALACVVILSAEILNKVLACAARLFRDAVKPEITKKLIIFRATAFLLVLAMLFACLNYLFQAKSARINNYPTIKDFYNEPNDTIETVVLGASVSYHGITPMELYENYGICAYDLGTANQPVHSSYYWLEEAYRLHEKTLKTVVFDVAGMRSDRNVSMYRLNTDAMDLSPIKWRAISDYTDSFEASLNYLIPLFSYHDRWSELSKADFTHYDNRDYLRGYYIDTLAPNSYFSNYSYSDLGVLAYYPDYGTDEMELKTESLYYLKKMIDFCREHDIKLVLIKTPGQSIGVSGHNAVQTIADKYGLDFLDFNYAPLVDEIGYDHAVDMRATGHVNYYGAKKLTAWLGKYLVEECGATDVRGVKGFEFMEDELKKYHSKVVDVIKLRDVTDPAEYLPLAFSHEDYAVFVAVKDDAGSALTEEQRQVFASLGLTSLSELSHHASYLAVIDGGVVLHEQEGPLPEEEPGSEAEDVGAEEDKIKNDLEHITMEDVRQSRGPEEAEELTISYRGELPDGTAYVLTSGGYTLGNKASVKLDGTEYASNERGLNIVIYDKEKKEVVNSAVFDTHSSPIRESGNLEAALASALERTDDYTTLSSDLKKLYLYDRRCENARDLSYLKRSAGDDGLLTYLDGVLSDKDHAVFLSVKDEGSRGLGPEVRAALYERGFEALSELEHQDSYLAVILGGELVYEEKAHGEGPISTAGEWAMNAKGRTSILYSVKSGGKESGNTSSIRIDGTEHSANKRGINIVVWDTVTNMRAASVTFDTNTVTVR